MSKSSNASMEASDRIEESAIYYDTDSDITCFLKKKCAEIIDESMRPERAAADEIFKLLLLMSDHSYREDYDKIMKSINSYSKFRSEL